MVEIMKVGRMGGWEIRRLEGWKNGWLKRVPLFHHSIIPNLNFY
jgi:hypothetical protein